ncbi:hypothetical protein ScFU53_03790 [Streptococcus canis]|nr:hypothetical protein ScFU1_10310 [Streptococcus canis]GFE48111.1 hypothetical protein ScFU129_17420 [Streptococcus canis]GFG43367.1 hypothetical protein ScFU53_03790 [Streptococcus canis]GFG45733.1 hypothetical protein ScFU93_09790 [Streptococcus canis]
MKTFAGIKYPYLMFFFLRTTYLKTGSTKTHNPFDRILNKVDIDVFDVDGSA